VNLAVEEIEADVLAEIEQAMPYELPALQRLLDSVRAKRVAAFQATPHELVAATDTVS
ncbi:MAG: hypothetical protein JSS20_10325, partial [Proteobacteria bacterium]|nr:hypothetical protein [Pseudomonadota bacterium]